MIRKDCPLSDKDKLYVILHHECTLHTHPNCLKGCSLNLEDELVKIMSEELAKEIDNEFIRRAVE